jgi:hypothetical protein
LVVKIPVTPIRTFEEYLKSLNRQRSIVDQYDADKRIVAPGVAPFFKCSQLLGDFGDLPPASVEKRGIRWLAGHPDYHRYLKIDDGFVFLMDLSAYGFLSDAIQRIHDLSAEIPNEIVSNPHVLGDFHGFENRYGRHCARIYFLMNGVWTEYEERARRLAREAGIRPRTIYEQRQWLLGQVAGLPREYPGDAPPAFVAALERVLAEVLEKNQDIVAAYRKTIKVYVKRIAFSKNIAKIRALVIILLDLLAWLESRRLAIRDLKPDNLFIAGDADRYSTLAADPEKYCLGLIDIETAIGLGADPTAQPLLGGTPSYATLSQFYPNRTLSRVYRDLPLILHLQDWYAAVVMIYEIVTGTQLFADTRKLLFDIKALSRKLKSDAGGPATAYCGSNYVFWLRAAEEFERNIQARRRWLEAVSIEPGDEARDMILRYARRQLESLSASAEKTIEMHHRLAEEADDDHLAGADWKVLSRYRRKQERKMRVAPFLSERQERILVMVKYLEGARRISESLEDGIADLEADSGEVSAYRLLKLMFSTVSRAMETPPPKRKAEGP